MLEANAHLAGTRHYPSAAIPELQRSAFCINGEKRHMAR
jgi:hypothetical protein